MKQLIRLILLLQAILLPAIATAHDFEVDGIYYNIINNNEAAVTHHRVYDDYVGDSMSVYFGDVTIPETVTFSGTTYTVTAIGQSAFSYSWGLKSISIPNSVTSIGESAFYYCYGLSDISIPSSVVSIGNNAFEDTQWYYDQPDGLVYAGLVAYKYKGWMPDDTEITLMDGTRGITDYAFEYCSELTSITIPNSVTSIGDCAFYGCWNLININIPDSVVFVGTNAFEDTQWYNDLPEGLVYVGLVAYKYKGWMPDETDITLMDGTRYIAAEAFYDCEGLTNITIPNSVTSIGPLAFGYCNGLTSVTIPNSVTSIGESAFFSCGLISVTIPNSITSIGNYAFSNCSGLTSVTIPNSVTSIGNGAFEGCSSLTSVSFGNSIATIGNYAFSGCTGLTSVTIPNSVTYIGEYAFYECSSLANVSLGNSIATIGDVAFSYCTGLADIEIPNSVTYIGHDAFSECSGLTSVTIPNSVTVLGDYAFADCSSLTGVDIPSSLSSIGIGVFAGCSAMTWVTIPNSVSSIGIMAFFDCSNLTSINIPNSVTTIDDDAFLDCTALTHINIPNSVIDIGHNPFSGCNNLTNISVDSGNPKFDSRNNCNAIIETVTNTLIVGCFNTVIPNSVITIGNSAFSNCTELTSITIPNSVTTIRDAAFWCCSGLTSIDIPNSVTSIGEYAFYDCSGLISVDIPNSVTRIGDSAFSSCRGLTSVTIPNSVTAIGNSVFYSCNGLTSIDIPNSVTSIGSGAFEHCSGLTSVTIPNSVTSIGSYAFSFCSGLTSVDIPNSVTTIGQSAFSGCSGLTSVTIPNSVTSIGDCAFENCDGVKDVFSFIVDPTAISMGYIVFSLYPADYTERTLHVPVGSVSAYQADTKWNKYFGHIYEIGNEPVLISSIELNETSTEIVEGQTLQLTATVLPEEATDKTVTWTSSDGAIATVDSTGLVTAITPGEAIITATTNDGSELSASCLVTVTSPVTPVGDNAFQVGDTTVMHGDIFALPVAMTNNETVMAFQTDVFLPEGFSVVMDEDDEYIIMPSGRLTNDHVIMADNANNGAVRVICYTPNSQPISGNEGDLFYIHVQVPDEAEGDYTISLRNTLLTAVGYNEVSVPDVSATVTVMQFIPGDVNDSRTVNVTDIVVAAQYILDRNPSPFIFEAADMNGDGNVTVTDVMLIAYLINHPTMNAPKRMPALTDCLDHMSGESVTLSVGEIRTVSIMLDNEMDYSAFQLDLSLPEGLTAGNFRLTDRAGSHAFDVNEIDDGKLRGLCYSPAIEAIDGHSGALLTFDVTATDMVKGDILVDGIELVTTDCQTVRLDGFNIGVNNVTSVNELNNGKTIDHVDYFNLAGQRIAAPESGVTLVVTTYTDGTRTTTKVMK